MLKNITSIRFYFTLLFLLFSACKKNSEKSVGLHASINGLAFKASNCESRLLGSALFILCNNADSTNASANFPDISFAINTNGIPTVGNFTIDTTNYQAWLDSSPYIHLEAISGSINITAVSPQIIGSFNFICSDSTKVSNGTFSVNYTN